MMQPFLKEVGRGKRGSRDLTYDESIRVAEMIFNGTASQAQIGAYLIAERMKMESMEEMIAFVDVCRSHSMIHPVPGSIDCAGPYDGRKKSFYATFPTAFVLCAMGIPVSLHSSPSLPPKNGLTLYDILQALDIPPNNMHAETLIEAAERTGFLFVPTEEWCPPLARLRGIRTEIGLRTLLNTVEKLIRFSDSPSMTVGIFHGTVFDKIVELLRRTGVNNGLVVQGMEGSEDISVERRTRALLVSEQQKEWLVIDPELLELQINYPEVKWNANLQAETILSVLKGNGDLAYYNTVLLNAGVRIWLCGKANSIEQGITQAKYVIDSGEALDQYYNWKNAVKTLSMKL
ncbi:anthranilate phosphoribosyltransferase [Aquibacillus albus]|uniref:Anthranilate phosphoribosyltransferase n=1 Tax=Aquibacillus albus TaxID=1168171 RepID=A0ABS2N2H8_9BACI|nr:anthranilate phosphoribosyltransferase [Aquibacillus albus]MBM7572329.1 anthranilate phosphoribosyltransferase [Aquibacillus albus]